MNNTPTPPKKQGRPPSERPLKKPCPIYITDQVREELMADGGPSPVINRLLIEAGYGKKSQSKI